MKKVLICYHSAQFGGVEKQILDLIEGLHREFEISIAVPAGPMVDLYLKNGAKKHYNIFPRSKFDLKYIFDLRYVLEYHKFDVVHAHELKTGVQAMLAGFIAGTKIRAYHVHTPFIYWKYNRFKSIKIIMNSIANFIAGNLFATDVLALTESVREIRKFKEGILSSKIRVIPNGVNVNEFKFNENSKKEIRHKFKVPLKDFLVLNVSRFTKEKGHYDLLDSLKIINFNKKFPNVWVMLAGAGPQNDFLSVKEYADKLNLSNIIFYHNFTTTDHPKLYSACDLFVFPTHAEGFGYAMVEAMAASRPILASNIDVLQDVGGNAVHYFKARDAVDLGQNMVYLINDANLRNDMSERAYHFVKQFDNKNFFNNYKKLYLGEYK